MKKIVCFFLVSFQIQSMLYAQNFKPVLHILDNKDEHLTEYYTYWLQPFEQSENVQIADSFFQKGNFIHWKWHKTLSLGDLRQRLWVRIEVQNDCLSSNEFIYSIHDFLDTANLYASTNSGFKKIVSATYWDISSKRIVNSRPLALPFKLERNKKVVLYLSINQFNNNLYFPLHIRTLSNFLQDEQSFLIKTHWFWLIGFYVFSILFISFLYLFLREKLYLWYCVYVFFNTMFMLMEDSIDALFLPQHLYTFIWHTGQYSFLLLSTATGIRIMQVFIYVKKKDKIIYYVGNFLMAISYLLVIFTFILNVSFSNYYNFLSVSWIKTTRDVLIFSNCFFTITSLLFLIKKGKRIAFYYAITYIFFFISCIMLMLNHLGITSINLLKPNIFAWGLFLELLTLVCLLVGNFRYIIQKNLNLQIENIAHQKNLLEKIVNVQEQERKRLGADLHDDVGSSVTSLNLFVSNYFIQHPTNDVNELHDRDQLAIQLQKLVGQVRDVAHELMPKDFEEKGFIKILTEKIQFLNTNQSLFFELLYTGNFEDVSKQVQITCYRIIIELLNNITKHAKASKSTIQLNCDVGSLQIIVEDDGIGLDRNKQVHDGIGLRSIESRISYLQGTINYDSSKLGTTIVIEIPLVK